MTIKERLVRNDKNTLVCHSERSEESHVLNGQIIIKNRNHCHTSTLRTHCRYSSSPKSSFRMTIKERLVRIDKNTLVCHSERSEESHVLNRRIIKKTDNIVITPSPRT